MTVRSLVLLFNFLLKIQHFHILSSRLNAEFSPERCASPGLNADTVLQTFSRTCYEFHVTRGESYDKAQQICKSHGKISLNLNLFIYLFE